MPNHATTYKHIIWDWNGTLVNDNQVCAQVLNTILAKYGKPPTTFAQYRRAFGFPIAAFYEGLGFDFSRESYDEIADDYINIYARRQFECQLHAGVSQVLQDCRDLGLGQSILSAYNQTMLEEAVHCFQISRYFTNVIGRQDFHAKSKIHLGRTLIRSLGISPQQVVIIGDTTHDFEVARDLRTHCLLIGNGHQHPDRLQPCGVPVLESIHEVSDWAKKSC